MKIVFSTKNVSRASFLDTCRYAYDYGFEGFEIYDAIKERSGHHDSILRRDRIADAKRKLVNRNLAVSALRMPAPVEKEETTAELIQKYVDMAASSGIDNVIVRVEESVSFDVLDEKLLAAIKRAEAADINVLFETVGYLANTENVIGIINHFASAAVGASWNVTPLHAICAITPSVPAKPVLLYQCRYRIYYLLFCMDLSSGSLHKTGI